MKTLLKIVGYGVGALVVVIAVAAITIFVRSNSKLRQTYAITVRPVSVPTDAAAIARGQHLATTRGCLDCHGADGGGAMIFENGAMGRVHAPNLTRGAGGLPANFSETDFARAIRHGVAADGRGLFLMPSIDYANFSDADLGALIAFLKTLPPVNRPRGPVELGPVARGLLAAGKIKLAAEEIDHANIKPAVVTPAVSVEYGRYVAASCIGCHGPNFSGGKIAAGPPDWPPAANLTPHTDSRIVKWQEEDFIKTIRSGRRPDGVELNAAMPRAFGKMDDTELKALWAFIKTLPAAATGVR